MPQGSSAHFVLTTKDMNKVREAALDLLRELGFKTYRRGKKEDRFKVEGTSGNWIVAMLANCIPFNQLFGFLTRVRATIQGQRSLNVQDDTCHLFIRTMPVDEYSGTREQYLLTQDIGERMGDNLQARRMLTKIVRALAAHRLIQI